MDTLKGKVAVVTGAGQGIGREEALALAAEGATVVVNDLGRTEAGDWHADTVVAEIRAAGGTAVAHYDDITEWAGGESLIALALEAGGLDVLVCNAGIVRDRMIYNMTIDEWDAVIRVHLRGHFVPTRLAATHWRDLSKSTGKPVDGRIIYTTSEAAFFGHIGQCNYAAAKAGITGLCFTAAQEVERVGVTVNTVSPRARTPMTEATFGEFVLPEGFDEWDPANVAPFVVFLAGPHAAKISGQVFVVYGGTVSRMVGWQEASRIETDRRWSQEELLERAPELANGLEAPPVFPVTTPGVSRSRSGSRPMTADHGPAGPVPAQPEQLRLDDDGPVLLGSHCRACGRSFFPRRWECPVDLTPVDDIELSRRGPLYVATHVRTPAYGRAVRDAEGYGVGEVDLPEGVRIQTVLLGPPEEWVPGTSFQIVGESVGEDEEGRPQITFRFRRAGDSGGDA